MAHACGVSYHTDCFRVGPPFTTRLRKGQGLVFPRVRHWGTFICEKCTVRAVVGRELSLSSDADLLRFERMRLIDMAHAWAVSTHVKYQQKLTAIRRFEAAYGFTFLRSAPLSSPPGTADIPLMWLQESYALRSSTRGSDHHTVSMGTVRQLRSAASQFLCWEMMLQHPLETMLDQQQHLVTVPCRATDALSFTLFTKGMTGRIGTDSTPSTPLLFRHIYYMDRLFLQNFLASNSGLSRRRWALAGLANCILWLGWLRSSELFGLTFGDLEVIHPSDGPLHDLPPGLGMVLLRLLPQTKSNRTSTADVVMAHDTLSGLSPGLWARRVALALEESACWPSQHPGPIFSEPDGSCWSSYFFRHNFLYPSLRRLQADGDMFLRPFTGSGSSIEDKFWSLHSYRRGARTHAGRTGSYNGVASRKATTPQIYEHGRWRRWRSGEAIDVQYNDLTYFDRLPITLQCL